MSLVLCSLSPCFLVFIPLPYGAYSQLHCTSGTNSHTVALWICTPLSLPQLQLWVTFPICWRAKRGEKKNTTMPLMRIIQNCNYLTTATCCCTETQAGVTALTACTQLLYKLWEATTTVEATSHVYVMCCHVNIVLSAYVHIHSAIRQQIKVWMYNISG